MACSRVICRPTSGSRWSTSGLARHMTETLMWTPSRCLLCTARLRYSCLCLMWTAMGAGHTCRIEDCCVEKCPALCAHRSASCEHVSDNTLLCNTHLSEGNTSKPAGSKSRRCPCIWFFYLCRVQRSNDSRWLVTASSLLRSRGAMSSPRGLKNQKFVLPRFRLGLSEGDLSHVLGLRPVSAGNLNIVQTTRCQTTLQKCRGQCLLV